MLFREFKCKKEVLKSREPVLVDFWASWCGPCRMTEPGIESLTRDVKLCKVNVDVNQPLAARYKISSVLALLIFKDGKVARARGSAAREAMAESGGD